jgi:hypothetical protein
VDSDPPRLTSDLDYWRVTLAGGQVLDLRAHGVKEDESNLVFVALMEGSPPFEYELLRLPRAAVVQWEGGWASPQG